MWSAASCSFLFARVWWPLLRSSRAFPWPSHRDTRSCMCSSLPCASTALACAADTSSACRLALLWSTAISSACVRWAALRDAISSACLPCACARAITPWSPTTCVEKSRPDGLDGPPEGGAIASLVCAFLRPLISFSCHSAWSPSLSSRKATRSFRDACVFSSLACDCVTSLCLSAESPKFCSRKRSRSSTFACWGASLVALTFSCSISFACRFAESPMVLSK
mmetsp:Transcript_71998/g.211371  ORF Transcript_71998/g.211371 Transcript_71998/m.211371 type:complete len:223 (-) Transcript_71998:2526-3194(-)